MQSPVFFEQVAESEMHCQCGSKVEWGLTTEYKEEVDDHVCCSCGTVVN